MDDQEVARSSCSIEKTEIEKEVAESNSKNRTTKPGIVYLSSIPYFMTVKSIRKYFAKYGAIDRVFLQVETRIGGSGKKERHYTEGWVEFKDKRLAKRLALTLNNTMVGGKRRSKAYECLWNIKYLSGFKWVHLTEQLDFEKASTKQKLRAEISQAKRQANFFAEQVDKGENLKKLEEKVLRKGGLWQAYERQIKQKSTVNENKSKKKKKTDDEALFGMIFNTNVDEKN